MNAQHRSRTLYVGMIGLMALIWSGSMPRRADAVPSFVETAHSGEQGATINADMDNDDPRLLRITFSAGPPAEPLTETPDTSLIPESGAQSDDLFAFRFPSGEPSQQPAAPAAPAATPPKPAASTVPEPSSLLLLLSGVAGGSASATSGTGGLDRATRNKNGQDDSLDFQ